MPHVLAVEESHLTRIKPTTPGGLYNLVLEMTDDKELAEKMRTEMQVQQKLAALAAEQ